MNLQHTSDEAVYRDAMGQLLVLYTQVDRLIMEACAERIAAAPDEPAKLALARQVGDESRHVAIQRDWMNAFGTRQDPVIPAEKEDEILAHFRQLDWLDFLADMYLCVEALGSDAVEQVVPLADPGTKESLRVPLRDELDHIAFGIGRLKQELTQLPAGSRAQFLARLPGRIEALTRDFHGLGFDARRLFEAVGADYDELCDSVLRRRDEILQEISSPLAA
jgi:hypothetical protein